MLLIMNLFVLIEQQIIAFMKNDNSFCKLNTAPNFVVGLYKKSLDYIEKDDI